MGWRRPLAGPGTRAARVAGAGLVVGSASVATFYFVLPFAARTLVRALTLTVNGCVWVATAMSTGADPWMIVSAIARAAGETLATPAASAALLLLVAVGALAFYGFQRLLGSDQESR